MSESKALFVPILAEHARQLADAFRGDVFLVGSALTTLTPRDIDMRCVLSRSRFEERYGGRAVEKWEAQGKSGNWGPVRWLWSRECVEVSGRLSDKTGLNVDFQVYPADYLEGDSHLLASYDEHALARLPEPDVDELNAMRIGETGRTG